MKSHTTNITLPPTMYKRLYDAATKKCQSMASIIRMALSEYFERHGL